MRDVELVLTFSLSSFILKHLISPHPLLLSTFPSSSTVINLYPCWVKNCTYFLWHVVYRNNIHSIDKHEVKQLAVAHKTAEQRTYTLEKWVYSTLIIQAVRTEPRHMGERFAVFLNTLESHRWPLQIKVSLIFAT